MAVQNTKTPAMVLQEFAVKKGIPPPEYVMVHSVMGTHENEFHYRVDVANVCTTGFGRSKQVAKHDAATKALEQLRLQNLYDPATNPAQRFDAQSHRNESDSPLKPPVNSIGKLKDICFDNKLPPPIFEEVSDVGPPHSRQFTCECKVASITTQATANTKKQAKQLCARDMLERINDICPNLLTEVAAVEANALMDRDFDVVAKFEEMNMNLGVIINKAVKVVDYNKALAKVMFDKKLHFVDFEDQFRCRDRESLDYILDSLDIKFLLQEFQQSPCIMMAILGIETPFTMMACESTQSAAERKCIEGVFQVLESLLQTDLGL